MLKSLLLFLALVLIPLGSAIGQQNNYSVAQPLEKAVDALGSSAYEIRDAKLLKVISKVDGRFEEKLLLSFLVPDSAELVQGPSLVELTGYKADGGAFGKHIWATGWAAKGSAAEGGLRLVKLAVDPKFEGASRFSITILPDAAALGR
jgi:hypothetical protein